METSRVEMLQLPGNVAQTSQKTPGSHDKTFSVGSIPVLFSTSPTFLQLLPFHL